VASAAKVESPLGPSDRLYLAIGEFLAQHRLSVDPAHYSFAHRVLSQAEGPLAAAVARITDGGVRLTSRDIEDLGGQFAGPGPTPAIIVPHPAMADARPDASPQLGIVATNDAAQVLVARAQMQVEDFADTVRAMRADTQGFGRDLREHTDAIRDSHGGLAVEEIVRMAGSMLDRVLSAEARLAAATDEAEDLRRKLEEARDDARRDPLTGLPNRRAFEDAFNEALATKAQISVALCDIDRFKSVNDRFGHAVGDRVLRAIAEALRSGCDEHFVARHGGEEFVVLFSGLSVPDAFSTLEGARSAVAAKRYRLRETDAPLGAVTFSGGVTPVEPGDTLGSVLGRADRLLYAAKAAGRNQVKID
jgi:diguanylate cyclase